MEFRSGSRMFRHRGFLPVSVIFCLAHTRVHHNFLQRKTRSRLERQHGVPLSARSRGESRGTLFLHKAEWILVLARAGQMIAWFRDCHALENDRQSRERRRIALLTGPADSFSSLFFARELLYGLLLRFYMSNILKMFRECEVEVSFVSFFSLFLFF